MLIQVFWSARSSFGYRSLPIYDASFSADATILALAHGSIVTLWDVETNSLLRTLDSGLSDVRQLGFVGGESRYLVASERYRGVAVWDLLSCEIVWSNVNAACHRLITSRLLPFFAAVHEPTYDKPRTVISIYKPTSSNAVRAVKVNNRIRWLSYLPPTSSGSGVPSARQLQFAGISHSGEVSRFGDSIAPEKATGTHSISAPEKSMSIWQEMFGKDAFLEIGQLDQEEPEEQTSRSRVGGKPTDIFEGASHTLPPVSLLFDSFLEQILAPGAQKGAEENGENGEKILYDVEEAAPAPLERGHKSRAVGEEEMVELEEFFRSTLSTTSPGSTATAGQNQKTLTNGRPTPQTNGRIVSGLANARKASTSTPLKSRPVEQSKDESEDEVDDTPGSGSSKKRGRKRKAHGERV